MPTAYKDWQAKTCRFLLKSIRVDYPEVINELPFKKAKISIEYHGKHGKKDLDNAAGAILDALVKAGILEDDDMQHVPELNVRTKRWMESKGVQIKMEI
jgi:Holliday junction resolvase RusA-like endonuclease